MSTWRSHHRTSTFVAVLTLAVLAGSLTSAGTAQGDGTAQAGAADPGPVVTLPFSNQLRPYPTIGAAGPLELNTLVSRECNNGAPLADQQWFTLPSAGTRLVVGRALRLVSYGRDRSPDPTRVGVAVVDHAAGRVLGCGPDPVRVTDGQPRSLVAWSDPAVLDECAAAVEQGCDLDPLAVFANWTSGRPPNDRPQDATLIDAVPYRATVDTTLADDDLPKQAGPCATFPDEASTVWWRFTPSVSGALPLYPESETYGPPGNEPVFHAIATIGRLVPGSPPTVEPVCADDRLAEVEAGTTYLIWLHDSYEFGGEPVPLKITYGAKATLTVGALRPTPPQDATATPGDQQVVLRWSSPAHPGSSGITGYQVTEEGESEGIRLPADARSFTARGLENGTSAAFEISAENAAGPGNPVRVSAVPTFDDRLPTEPTGVRVVEEPSLRRVTVTWGPPASSGASAITGYRLTRSGVDRSGAGPLDVLLPASARRYVLTDLKRHTAYGITLRALNAVGAGRPVETGAILDSGTPSEPRAVTATAGPRSAAVNWGPPLDLGQSGVVTAYRVRRYAGDSSTPEATDSVAGTATSFGALGLTAGATYRFDVTAINGVGTGEPSPRTDPVTPTATPTPPLAPTSVRAAQGSTVLSTATLRWDPPVLDGGSPITGYRVARNGRDTSGAGPWSTTLPAGARSGTFTRLRAWDTYALSVQAINVLGAGPVVTRWVTVTDPRPSAPTSVTAVPGDASVTVTWRAPQHRAESVTGYRIRSYSVPGSTPPSSVTVSATVRRLVVPGLTGGSPYRFDVTALNSAGAGVPSGPTSAVVPGAAR